MAINNNKDFLIHSIVTRLANRGYFLGDKILSFYSIKTENFIAVAKLPIPLDAVIPVEDLGHDRRIHLKIWPLSHLPNSILISVADRVKMRHA